MDQPSDSGTRRCVEYLSRPFDHVVEADGPLPEPPPVGVVERVDALQRRDEGVRIVEPPRHDLDATRQRMPHPGAPGQRPDGSAAGEQPLGEVRAGEPEGARDDVRVGNG